MVAEVGTLVNEQLSATGRNRNCVANYMLQHEILIPTHLLMQTHYLRGKIFSD